MSTLLQCDVAQLVYVELSTDATLEAIAGLTITLERPRGNLAKTSKINTQGNQRVVIRKERCGPSSWTCGGRIKHDIEFVTLIITCFATADAPAESDARALCLAIRKRIKELMFSFQPLGVGWLWHREVTDRFPAPPLAMYAHNILTYEIHTTSGMV